MKGCSKSILDLHKPFWSDEIEDGSPGSTAVKFLLFNSSAVSLGIINKIALFEHV